MTRNILFEDTTTLEPAIRLVLSRDHEGKKGRLDAILSANVTHAEVAEEPVGIDDIRRVASDFTGWLQGDMPEYRLESAVAENAPNVLARMEFDIAGKEDDQLISDFNAAFSSAKKSLGALRFGIYRVNDTPPEDATIQRPRRRRKDGGHGR